MLSALREYFEDHPWRTVTSADAIGWGIFYLLFLLYAAAKNGEFLFIDFANLVIHEAGHPLFSYFGDGATVWGGTILQWFVPFALAMYFFTQRQVAAFVFSMFFFFENWLYTATYMADARAQALPLVSIGGGEGDENMHDWYNIFSRLGVLNQDVKIAHVVRVCGWVGMLGCVAFLIWRYHQSQKAESLASFTTSVQ
jgi:hypothetical protein